MAIARLPFVFVNIAMTADGKIAPASRQFVPFGSKRDKDHMHELRSEADAVMSGARTVDQPGVTLGAGSKKWREVRVARGLAPQSLRVIVSGSGSISPEADIFKKRFSPLILLTTEAVPSGRLKTLRTVFDDVHVSDGESLDFPAALAWLRGKWNVKKLLCEGGGELNAPLFLNGLVNELHLTICPLILGGRDAPTLADGIGVEKLAEASRLKLVTMEEVKDELFCVYRKLKA